MSESIGDVIPPPLRFEMGKEGKPGEPVHAFLLVSVDEGGCPRVAILAPSEVKALDEHRMAVSVQAGTHTARNMKRGSDVLVWCVLNAAAYSLCGAAEPVGEKERFATFHVTVRDVLRDFYSSAPMISGATFRRMA